jgi:aspartyl-tRNA(Asn)/glutamyl-tRNA(Gln) amidotransferase subunit C
MSGITEEQTRQIAEIARLKLSEEEVKKFTKQLQQIVEYVEQLNEVPTDHVAPTSRIEHTKNVLRDDIVKQWISRDEALKNVPEHKDGLIKVPAILD